MEKTPNSKTLRIPEGFMASDLKKNTGIIFKSKFKYLSQPHSSKFEDQVYNYLFALKNYRPCRDLNLGLLRYQADMLPTELSWLGLIF